MAAAEDDPTSSNISRSNSLSSDGTVGASASSAAAAAGASVPSTAAAAAARVQQPVRAIATYNEPDVSRYVREYDRSMSVDSWVWIFRSATAKLPEAARLQLFHVKCGPQSYDWAASRSKSGKPNGIEDWLKDFAEYHAPTVENLATLVETRMQKPGESAQDFVEAMNTLIDRLPNGMVWQLRRKRIIANVLPQYHEALKNLAANANQEQLINTLAALMESRASDSGAGGAQPVVQAPVNNPAFMAAAPAPVLVTQDAGVVNTPSETRRRHSDYAERVADVLVARGLAVTSRDTRSAARSRPYNPRGRFPATGANAVAVGRDARNEDTRVCYACGGRGHFAAACANNRVRSDNVENEPPRRSRGARAASVPATRPGNAEDGRQ